MIFTNADTVPNHHIGETLGIVTGNVVQAKNIGRDVMAGLKSIVGGELKGYTELMAEARNLAIERMVDEARAKNADAVITIRFCSSQVMDGAAEVMVYGTAVKFSDS